ncbi:MBL fold metallo-hydrolase [Candidatus Micrarchaeota archaeon]|nr:MBL fold metallo-hydrolase [Candidatus Micrarchaeota archaeon]
MKLTVLGSGTAILDLKRNAPAFLLEFDNGKNALLDIGPGSLKRLLELGKTINDIDYIFLSHFHPDHCLDLIHLLFVLKNNKYLNDDKEGNITIISSKEFEIFYNNLITTFYGETDARNKIIFKNIDEGNIELDNITISAIKVKHNDESRAFKIEHNNKTVVYSGDTGYDEELKDKLGEFAKNSDVFLLECAFSDEYPASVHLNPTAVGKIAQKVTPKKLVLFHFYPKVQKTDIKGIVNKYYNGDIILSKGKMKIEI